MTPIGNMSVLASDNALVVMQSNLNFTNGVYSVDLYSFRGGIFPILDFVINGESIQQMAVTVLIGNFIQVRTAVKMLTRCNTA